MNVELSQDDVQNIINAYDKDIKKMEEQEKEINRLNNIIKDLIKDIEIIVECEDVNIIKMQLRTCLYNKLKALKENK